MEYTAIVKGRGFVYVHDSQLYYRIQTAGWTKYLKCTTSGCLTPHARLVFTCGGVADNWRHERSTT